MLWDVYVVDCIDGTCEIVLTSVSFQDAKSFQSVWEEPDSFVVILPFCFEVRKV